MARVVAGPGGTAAVPNNNWAADLRHPPRTFSHASAWRRARGICGVAWSAGRCGARASSSRHSAASCCQHPASASWRRRRMTF
eukprot:15459363-Alexandrium_andersonii.AAC.1